MRDWTPLGSERVHICGDPNSACDGACMDRANAPRAKFSINDRVAITRDGKVILGKIDEIVLFRRENKIGYRVIDENDWSWYYCSEDEINERQRRALPPRCQLSR